MKLCFLGVKATTRHAAVLFRIDSEEAQAKAYRKGFNITLEVKFDCLVGPATISNSELLFRCV